MTELEKREFAELIHNVVSPMLLGIEQRLTGRIDDMDARLGGVEQHIGGMDARLGGVEQRIGGMDARLGGVEQHIDGMDERLGGVDQHIGSITQRLDGIASDVTLLKLKHENEVMPAIRQIADGHEQLVERLDMVQSQLNEVHQEQLAQGMALGLHLQQGLGYDR